MPSPPAPCLIPQTWTYEGLPFGVGRPELVGTVPDYRNRGLVRAQFDVFHTWCQERGLQVQAITGIPYFYRLFGYEMAVGLGGGRMGYQLQIPKLEEAQGEPYHLRPAVSLDLAFLAKLDQSASARSLVACPRDKTLWRYELSGKSHANVDRQEVHLIETFGGEPAGFLVLSDKLRRGRVEATAYELKPGLSWRTVTPSVIRGLWARGEELAAKDAKQELQGFAFVVGDQHPVFEVSRAWLPHTRKPYAWYLRVGNLPAFLRLIQPVLERRLGRLAARWGTQERSRSASTDPGSSLALKRAPSPRSSPGSQPSRTRGALPFPNLVFLKLLFGYRTLDELMYAQADCWAADKRPAHCSRRSSPRATPTSGP